MNFTPFFTWSLVGFIVLMVIQIALCIILVVLLYKFFKLSKKDTYKEKEIKKQKYKYTAVIIETRNHRALPFLIDNLLENLSEEWSIILFHGNLNRQLAQTLVQSRLSLVHTPVDEMNTKSYNLFMKSPFLYEKIPTEIFLIAQCDSMIIPRFKHFIDDFIKYDYVGAPWKNPYLGRGNEVGNGGFSLRRKSKMLEIINMTKHGVTKEDLFFSCPPKIKLSKPNTKQASRFSFESILVEESFSCHKPWMYLDHDELFTLYPEIKELYNLQ
jgi:hypothetical protein